MIPLKVLSSNSNSTGNRSNNSIGMIGIQEFRVLRFRVQGLGSQHSATN